MWETIATTGSTVIAGIALLAGWLNWRREELRRGDVLVWTNEVIEALQTLFLICDLGNPPLDHGTAKSKLLNLIFQTSILVEQGRLFFRNEVIDDFGAHKHPAYRGYRPKILDPIVVAHQIACDWLGADSERRLRLRIISEDCLKKFVSLAQKEVGRDRTASADTKRGGDGAHLRHLLSEVDERRLAKLRATIL